MNVASMKFKTRRSPGDIKLLPYQEKVGCPCADQIAPHLYAKTSARQSPSLLFNFSVGLDSWLCNSFFSTVRPGFIVHLSRNQYLDIF